MAFSLERLRPLRPIAAPAAILAFTALSVTVGPPLPPSLAGLSVIGPYVLLGLGAAISAWFNRSRAFIALSSLLAAYGGYSLTADLLGAQSFPARAVFVAMTLAVPANVLAALVFPERGVRQHRNYRWWLLALAEAAAIAWIASSGRSSLSGTFWRDLLDHWLFAAPPTPLAGRVLLAAALAAAFARAWPRPRGLELRREPRPLDVGLVGALLAFFIACEWANSARVFGGFMAAAGAILLIAVLQESHRMAYRDELTGIASRRALEERLPGLGPRYTVAMVDVDHFKAFNDTHGHAIGDQVLRLVATRLAEAGGGGIAFRYGGEEFCLLFPDRSIEEAMPVVEKLRRDIESYRMTVRAPDRPKSVKAGERRRGSGANAGVKTLAVTVSIGIAQADDKLTTPGLVLRAADEALYRAKRGGRNRVSV